MYFVRRWLRSWRVRRKSAREHEEKLREKLRATENKIITTLTGQDYTEDFAKKGLPLVVLDDHPDVERLYQLHDRLSDQLRATTSR